MACPLHAKQWSALRGAACQSARGLPWAKGQWNAHRGGLGARVGKAHRGQGPRGDRKRTAGVCLSQNSTVRNMWLQHVHAQCVRGVQRPLQPLVTPSQQQPGGRGRTTPFHGSTTPPWRACTCLTCAAGSRPRGTGHAERARCSILGTRPCRPRVKALSSAATPDAALRPGAPQLERQAAAPCIAACMAAVEHSLQSVNISKGGLKGRKSTGCSTLRHKDFWDEHSSGSCSALHPHESGTTRAFGIAEHNQRVHLESRVRVSTGRAGMRTCVQWLLWLHC